MGHRRIDFPSRDWTQGGHPLELKKADADSGLTLLRFKEGFEDPNLCLHGHWLYVFEGTFELEFEEETVTLVPGQACTVDVGTAHRARNAGSGEVRLLVKTEAPPGLLA